MPVVRQSTEKDERHVVVVRDALKETPHATVTRAGTLARVRDDAISVFNTETQSWSTAPCYVAHFTGTRADAPRWCRAIVECRQRQSQWPRPRALVFEPRTCPLPPHEARQVDPCTGCIFQGYLCGNAGRRNIGMRTPKRPI